MIASRHQRANSPTDRRQAGFSLVEVLVSLALVALLTVGLVSGLGSGMRVWEISDDSSEALSEAAVLDSVFRRHFSGAMPVRIIQGTRNRLVYFVGSADRIRFFTTAEAGVGSKGAYGEEMLLRRSEGRTELVIRRGRLPLDAFETDLAPDWDEAIISLGSPEMEFAFYPAQAQGEMAPWRANWQGQRSLPALVGLGPASNNMERFEPVIVAAPHLTASPILLHPRSPKHLGTPA